MPTPRPSPANDRRKALSAMASIADLHARVEDLKDTLTILTEQFEKRFAELRQHFSEIQEQKDLQHAQRFEAQQLALRDALTAAEKAVAAALAAAEKAVSKAEVANEKRFESVNEFRKALTDQATLQMPRPEAMALFAALEEKIRVISKVQDMNTGKGTGVNMVWVAMATVVTIIVGVIGMAAGLAVVAIMLVQNHK